MRKIHQSVDPVPPSGYEAAANGRGQRFGETPDVHNTVKAIERRKARGRFMFEIGKDVIFDDCDIVLFGELEQPMGDDGR